MLKITVEEMDILKDLQNIEDESWAIKRSLEKVETEIADRKMQLADSETKLAVSENDLSRIRAEYRDYEIEVEERNTRLKKSEEYIKTVSSNSEYQLLLREIDDNRKRNAEIETQMIEYLEQIEAKEKEILDNKNILEKISRQVEDEIAGIEQTCNGDRISLEEINKKRDKISGKLNPRIYKRFSNIINQTGGKGLVAVTNSVCAGCYMNIPPQMYIEVQRGENLYFCPQCQRMLYYKEE